MICCLQKTHFRYKNTKMVESNGKEYMHLAHISLKNWCYYINITQVDFKTKSFI